MYNFIELKDAVANLAQQSGTTYKNKIGVWLNLSQDFLFNVYDYYLELQDIHNFSTVDGTADYYMPNRFDKPLRVYDITNNVRLTIEPEVEYFDANIANVADAEEGQPTTARIYGVEGVTAQVATTGDTVKANSSSSSDTDGVIIRVEGYLDSSLTIIGRENITISTSSPTTYVAGTTTFYKITHVSKSADTTGYITLADSSDNVLAYIEPTGRILQHKVMKLGLIPDDAYNMRVLFKRKYYKMINDYDYPFVGTFDNYFILDAWGWSLSQLREGVDRAATVWAKAKDALTTGLTNIQGKLGPDFTQKMSSMWSNAHRF